MKTQPYRLKIIITFLVFTSIILSACVSQTIEKENQVNKSDTLIQNGLGSSTENMESTHEKTYDLALMDNKKDPTCGMPVTAGVSDTAHYDSKIFGFCSSECKAEFLKNPKANKAAAELKTSK